MQQLSWFKKRINSTILRGTTEVKVTEDNYKKLFDIQTVDIYKFKDKEYVHST